MGHHTVITVETPAGKHGDGVVVKKPLRPQPKPAFQTSRGAKVIQQDHSDPGPAITPSAARRAALIAKPAAPAKRKR